MFDLASGYAERAMSAYVELQEAEFAAESAATPPPSTSAEAGTGYFDFVSTALNPDSATLALVGSTEAEQFTDTTPRPTDTERAGP
jgi:isocitrate lyase